MARPTHNEYHIGWICALSVEMVAATAMLDEDYGIVKGKSRDQNTYHAGRVHDHNVVIAGLPAGIDGLVAAAHVAKDMVRTFEHLKFIMLVGIGGGLPGSEKGFDIRLGDVVVGIPSGTSGGVVHYDKGKATHGGAFELKAAPNTPPYVLLTAITAIRAQPSDRDRPMLKYLSDMIHRYPCYGIPSEQKDRLFDSRYPHPEGQNNCEQCLPRYEIIRQSRTTTGPQIHYGIVASGNKVVKDPLFRDNLRASYGALCVEMEAAGLANISPFLTVRGICDYADSHKNDEWHPYAAATAAAWTKELLLYVTAEELDREQTVKGIAGSDEGEVQPLREQLNSHETNFQNTEYQSCHRAFKLSSYEEQKNVNPSRAPDTCLWVLSNPKYRQWQENKADDVLWVSADPGCGKSVLSKSLIDHELQTTKQRICCYFFFKENQNQDNLASAFCALLHQLFTSQPHLLAHAIPAWRRNGDQLTKEVDELWRIFLAATADTNSRDVFCVLDALDECRDVDRPRLIDKLAVFFADAQTTKPRTHSLKILVTSRPYDSIQLNFQRSMNGCCTSVPIIRLRGENENNAIRSEIDLVIRRRVAEMAEIVPLSLNASELLVSKLLRMQNRTYLWLSLVIDGIYENLRDSLQHDEDSINSIIATLPASVDDAYEKILSKVRTNQRDIVRTIFHIIVGAQEPLSLGEMSLALGYATSKDVDSLDSVLVEKIRLQNHIREWCGLFVFIERSKIYLVHQTAKEFLIRHSEMECGVWKHSLSSADTARTWTKIYLRAMCWPPGVLHRSESGDPEVMVAAKSLKRYAKKSWYIHLRDAKMNGFAPLHDELCLLWDRLTAGAPLELYWELGYAAHRTVDLETMLDLLIEVVAYFPPRRNPCRVILYCAAAGGRAETVRKILEIGAGLNLPALDDWDSAVQVASDRGDDEVLRILLSTGTKFNCRRKCLDNALLVAAQYGREQVVRTLLDAGADVNYQGGYYGNALQAAAFSGHEQVVRTLLHTGANINHQGGYYGNALQAAIKGCHGQVVRILLEAGADVWAEGRCKNAFEAASMHHGMMDLMPHPNLWPEQERSLVFRLWFLNYHHDEAFWLSISSDVDEVKQIINSQGPPSLQWHTDTLASFKFANFPRQYIRLGFLRRLKEKERSAEARSMIPSIPGQWVD
ncbi:uncharacterized protein PV07_03844 [Cladophialophora immunda]|uniref:Uncharacterized protein n=1 Tax=Cladophialophora immunda TaxID=569365 RepID=A0A0D1ZVR8_9EURO|nr:uncharacterized protein PV07_03844 [Cladophialophora immunda]KIW32286.1 hypothetical protein PV07_03844 [Cladophialophora immunda]